jgi:hypothetical protein
VLLGTSSQVLGALPALQIFNTVSIALMVLTVSSVSTGTSSTQRVLRGASNVPKPVALNATLHPSAPSVPETITFSIQQPTPANSATKLYLTASDALTPTTAAIVKSVSTKTLPINALSVLETVSSVSQALTAVSAKSGTLPRQEEAHAADALMQPAFPATKLESVTTVSKALSSLAVTRALPVHRHVPHAQ